MASIREHSLNVSHAELVSTTSSSQFEGQFPDFFQQSQNETKQDSLFTFLLISYSQNRLITKYGFALMIAISLLGSFCNAVNILIFLKMGLDDSVTISFFALSVTDLSLLLIAIAQTFGGIISALHVERGIWFYVKPQLLTFILAHTREMFSVNTTILTTFLAVQRCFCIVRPLHFKGVFTRRRAVYALCLAAAVSLICFMPVLVLLRTRLGLHIRSNKTHLVLAFAGGWDTVVDFNESLAGIFIPCSTQVIVLFCLVVMTAGLKKSARFRKRAVLSEMTVEQSSKQDEQTQDDAKARKSNAADASHEREDGHVKGDPAVLSKKDKNVLMQVLLICLIFVVCNSPKIAIAFTRIFVPGFDHGGIYQFVYTTTKLLRTPFELFNSAVNMFVYYKYNSKFRLIFGQTFRFHNRDNVRDA